MSLQILIQQLYMYTELWKAQFADKFPSPSEPQIHFYDKISRTVLELRLIESKMQNKVAEYWKT